MGRKLLVSLAMEGKFTGQGLGREDDDDVLTAMARELVTEKGVGETAAAVWKTLQRQGHNGTHSPSPIEAPVIVPAAAVHLNDEPIAAAPIRDAVQLALAF